MVQTEKGCVLAIDVSGSVRDFKFYWDQVEELLNELLSRKYSSYTVVAWSSRYEGITVETLRQYIKMRCDSFGGGTCPDLVWDFLHTEKLPHYDLHLVTDGEIANKRYNRYIDMYYSLKYKPEVIYIYYFGRLGKMNMQFLDCFKNVQYVINGIDTNNEIVTHTSTKVDKDALFQQLCGMDEFKQIEANANAKDLVDILQNLYKKLYRKIIEYSEKELNGAIGDEFKKFVALINEMVHRNQDDVDSGVNTSESAKMIHNEMAKHEEAKDPATRFDELFLDYKSNSKEIFDIFVRRFLDATTVDHKKILQQIVELGSGQSVVDRRLLAYGENWYGIQKQKNCDGNDDAEDDVEYGFTTTSTDLTSKKSVSEAKRSNSSFLFSSPDASEFNKFCVILIGVDEHFGGIQFRQMLDTSVRPEVEKSPLRLFEFLSYDNLKKRIPAANGHISMETALGLESTKLDSIVDKNFDLVYKSPFDHAPCFGIVLYNADNDAEFSDKISQNEINIISYNYATIAQLLFGDPNFNGSFPLLHTFFLQILNQRAHGGSSYTKKCIEKTIERTSAILECRFMLDSGLEPSFHSSIKNAILFHTDIYPNEIDKLTEPVPGLEALNIPRKHVEYCSGLLDLAENQFGVKYSDEYGKKLKLWRFWNYMLDQTDISQDEKLLHFKQIALSKAQNWQPIECEQVKIMFIEGKSEQPYLAYLDDIQIDDIVKLIILFETSKVKTPMTNIPIENIELAKTDEWYNVETVEKIDEFSWSMRNVQFCKTTCAYPVISPFAKILIDLIENKKFNLIDQGVNSSIILHSNYLQNCEDLIVNKSGNEKLMKIPTVDELKKYIVSKAPMAVYHTDIDDILENIINKYRNWKIWYENVDENEMNKHLWIDTDWKKIFAHKVDAKNNERLQRCDCEAHQHLSLANKLRSLNENNPMIIYSFLFIFIALIVMLFK